MNIKDLIEEDGFILQRKSTTMGGEYSGSCPWCSGRDRFSVHPEKDHYVCRSCKKAGDSIQYLKEYRNLTYRQACSVLGVAPNVRLTAEPLKSTAWTPRETTTPPPTWQHKAEKLAFAAHKHLLSPAGNIKRQYLHSRGISQKTIKQARIGFMPKTKFYNRTDWGLPQEKNDKGNDKKIWVPAGFVIPFFDEKKITRIRVRQDKPLDSKKKYIIIAGSETRYMTYPGFNPDLPCMIVEAELDGWLIWAEARAAVNPIAVGNSSARPDIKTHKLLDTAAVIKFSLDNDEAGRAEVEWWEKQYPQTEEWFSTAKDAGDDFKAKINILEWVIGRVAPINDSYCEPDTTTARESISIQPITTAENIKPRKEAKKPENSPEKINKPDKKKYTYTSLCRHNEPCIFLTRKEVEVNDFTFNRLICTLHKKQNPEIPAVHFMDIEKCPRNYWNWK